MKPILFDNAMVQAILDGRKTVARRAAFPHDDLRRFRETEWWFEGRRFESRENALHYIQHDTKNGCEYQPGEILYVRETWARISELTDVDPDVGVLDGYIYKADWGDKESIKWHPPINMPKEAARIFLRVTDVQLERLQDITNEEAVREGANKLPCEDWVEERTERTAFSFLWDGRVKPKDLAVYGWDANPWVWVISFERCEKPDDKTDFRKILAKGR